jgi:hypothetical protein
MNENTIENREVPHGWTVGGLLERKNRGWKEDTHDPKTTTTTECLNREDVAKLWNDLRGVLDTVEPSANMLPLRDDPLEILEILKDYVVRAEAAFDTIDNILNVEFPEWAKGCGEEV